MNLQICILEGAYEMRCVGVIWILLRLDLD